MNEARNETTLAQVRLRWGIFILPVLTALPLVLPALAVLLFIHLMDNSLRQLNVQATFSVGLMSFIIFLPAILIGALLSLAVWIAYVKSIITLTNRRLMYRTGLIVKVAGELPLENVDAIFMVEPLLGRLLGYGTVIVTSTGGLRFPLRYIGTPQNFHRILQQAVNEAKNPVPPISKVPDLQVSDDSRYMPKV